MNNVSFIRKIIESMTELYTHYDPFAAQQEEPEVGSSTFLEDYKPIKSKRRKYYDTVATPVPRRQLGNMYSGRNSRFGNKHKPDALAGGVKLSKEPLSRVKTVTSAFKLDLNAVLLRQSLHRAIGSPGSTLYLRCPGVWFCPSRSLCPFRMVELYTCPHNWIRHKPLWQEVCI